MAKYIDREAALQAVTKLETTRNGYDFTAPQIKSALASIEAADVVLCKDCAYCYREGSGTMTMCTCAFPRGGLRKLLDPEKDFCSCGTWRTNNGKT